VDDSFFRRLLSAGLRAEWEEVDQIVEEICAALPEDEVEQSLGVASEFLGHSIKRPMS